MRHFLNPCFLYINVIYFSVNFDTYFDLSSSHQAPIIFFCIENLFNREFDYESMQSAECEPTFPNYRVTKHSPGQ